MNIFNDNNEDDRILFLSPQISSTFGWYSNKYRGLCKKQSILKSGNQPLDEIDEAIEVIDVSE